MNKSKKKLNGLDKYVIFSISVTLVYTVAEFVVSTVTGISHDALSACVYGFFCGEVVSCAFLKKWKLKRGDEDV